MSFNCSKCGLCCSIIGKIIEKAKNGDSKFEKEIVQFPHKWDKNGKCEMLNEDNTCRVYDNRPDMCNVNKTYKNHFSDKMTKENFYSLNEKSCLTLQNNK